ncbi:MAG: hypothetical protein KGL39_14515 [Patescibacteria group bacterium]|nr:hypothetical protein [Patescibacteria group bacterium]
MLIPKWLLEKVFSATDRFSAERDRQTENCLNRILEAKQNEVNAMQVLKDQHIKHLEDIIAEVKKERDHERARAESAIDILLRKNHTPSITDAAAGKDAIEAALKQSAEMEKAQVLAGIFHSVNEVGEEGIDLPSKQERPTQ